jgi:hypothetical protein
MRKRTLRKNSRITVLFVEEKAVGDDFLFTRKIQILDHDRDEIGAGGSELFGLAFGHHTAGLELHGGRHWGKDVAGKVDRGL